MKRILKFMDKIYRKRTILTCTFIALAVIVADYPTGKHVRFPIFDIIPAIMAAGMNGKAIAYGIAVFLPLLRLGFTFHWHETQSLSLSAINALISVTALILIVYLVDGMVSQARRLRILEGIFPICASCKRIRNDKGE